MKRIAMLAGLLCFASPALAEDLLTFNVLVSQQGFGFYYMEQLAVFEKTFNSSTLSFGPTDFYPDIAFDLGRPDAAWRNGYFDGTVNASTFAANGAVGLNEVIRIGPCKLTIQGGLIVAADRCH